MIENSLKQISGWGLIAMIAEDANIAPIAQCELNQEIYDKGYIV